MTVLQHLKDRHLNLKLHRPFVCENEGTATFMLYSLSGKLVGYQQYRPGADKKPYNHPKESKYYTYRKQPTHAPWGVESLFLSSGVVFLTEGLFDSARMTYHNRSSLASLCNNPPKDFKNFLQCLGRPVVAVCDADSAGRKLAYFGDYVEVVPEGKDLGDAPDDYVHYLLNKYSS